MKGRKMSRDLNRKHCFAEMMMFWGAPSIYNLQHDTHARRAWYAWEKEHLNSDDWVLMRALIVTEKLSCSPDTFDVNLDRLVKEKIAVGKYCYEKYGHGCFVYMGQRIKGEI